MADTTAPAIATTKRKFYKLLDGLNSSTSVKTNKAASTATLHEPASKRSRISLESEVSSRPTSVRQVGSTIITRTSHGTVLKAPLEPAKTPNYQPYSQERFLERLKTFSDVKVWTYKPSDISEVQWAKRGWVCEARQVDTVACKGGCEARVVVQLERGRERSKTLGALETGETAAGEAPDEEQWDGEPDEELIKRYSALVVEGHREGCLWRTGGCKDDIYRVRMADAGAWQKELIERYESLISVGPSLPDRLKYPAPDDHEDASTDAAGRTQAQTSIGRLSNTLAIIVAPPSTAVVTHETSGARQSTFNIMAATLALFGWSGSSPHNIHLATCGSCFQRIGLWLYTSNPSNKAMPSAESGIADDDILRFDLAELHRECCPWINGESQAGLGTFSGLAAWEILVQLVKNRERREQTECKLVSRTIGEADSDEEDAVEKSREDVEKEDREREGKLARLKRVFTVRKTNKSENRKSWKSFGR